MSLIYLGRYTCIMSYYILLVELDWFWLWAYVLNAEKVKKNSYPFPLGDSDARHWSPCTRPAPITNWPVGTVLAVQPLGRLCGVLERDLRVSWGVTLQDRELLHLHTVTWLIQSSPFSHLLRSISELSWPLPGLKPRRGASGGRRC